MTVLAVTYAVSVLRALRTSTIEAPQPHNTTTATSGSPTTEKAKVFAKVFLRCRILCCLITHATQERPYRDATPDMRAPSCGGMYGLATGSIQPLAVQSAVAISAASSLN
jgi:hypothetical protein